MELSVLAAKILALFYLSSGIAVLKGKMNYGKIIEDFEKSPALTFMTGFIALVFGMVLVQYHNIWVKDWTVLITFVGWASVFKGIMLIAFPKSMFYFKSWYKNSKVWGILLLALGFLFGYFGFIA